MGVVSDMEKKLGIGEVRKILAEEFPDLTISKIRFLEKEGLITVDRTPSGYRKFSREDIQKLKFILRLQREQYLPLEVIKKKIRDFEHGKVTASDLVAGLGEQGGEDSLSAGMTVTVDAAPNKLGMTPKTIQDLVDYNLVDVHQGDEGDYFKPEDVAILQLAKRFSRFGIEPRHLRMYVQFNNRQAAFFEQIVRPQLRHRDPTVRRGAYRDLEDLIELSRMLSDSILRARLSEYLPEKARAAGAPAGEEEVPSEDNDMGEEEVVEDKQEIAMEAVAVGEEISEKAEEREESKEIREVEQLQEESMVVDEYSNPVEDIDDEETTPGGEEDEAGGGGGGAD